MTDMGVHGRPSGAPTLHVILPRKAANVLAVAFLENHFEGKCSIHVDDNLTCDFCH